MAKTSNHLPQGQALRNLGNGKPSFFKTLQEHAVMMSQESKILWKKILLRLVVERAQSFLVSCEIKLWRMHEKYFHHFNVCVDTCLISIWLFGPLQKGLMMIHVACCCLVEYKHVWFLHAIWFYCNLKGSPPMLFPSKFLTILTGQTRNRPRIAS